MKKLLFVVFFFTNTCLQGQVAVGTIQVGKDTFTTVRTLVTTEYTDEPIRKINFCKKKTKLLTHTIREVWGDDNSETIELGAYKATDSTITFYSYWARAGDAPISPFGVRKQVYKVTTAGRLYLVASELYIETARKGWEENKGIRYLFKPPKTNAERKSLAAYISATEKKYDARFVFGKKADTLFKEVREQLGKEIYEETKGWDKVEAYKAFGYKK